VLLCSARNAENNALALPGYLAAKIKERLVRA